MEWAEQSEQACWRAQHRQVHVADLTGHASSKDAQPERTAGQANVEDADRLVPARGRAGAG